MPCVKAHSTCRHRLVRAQKVQDDAVGLGKTAASSAGLVSKLYAALTFAFAGAGASYLLLSNETLTVRGQCLPFHKLQERSHCTLCMSELFML